jgi:hypothetical protein
MFFLSGDISGGFSEGHASNRENQAIQYMRTHMQKMLFAVAALATFNLQLATTYAQGTAFVYQGRLISGGTPATGIYDLTFALFDTDSAGNQVGGTLTNSPTAVTNGLFAVTLDFGPGVFDGTARWLELGVRTNGVGSFTILTPRQPILPVPYAIMAGSASNLLGDLPAGQLAGSIANGNLPTSPNFSGTVVASTFSGDGNYLTNLNSMSLSPGFVGASLYLTNQFNSFNGNFFGFHSGDGNYLTNLNPMSLSPGFVGSSLYLTNQFNSFNGNFFGFHSGDGNYLTNLNSMSLSPGFVGSSLYLTNQFNSFNGNFFGFHSGDGNYLTNLNSMSLSPGFVGASLYLTNQFNSFNGNFFGFHSGDGNYLTNLNPMSLSPGFVSSSLYLTNQFNSFNGNFFGFHSGDGHYLTNLNPMSLASGFVGSSLYLTNQFNSFNGNFFGFHSGDGHYLTNLSVDAVSGGLTINVAVLVPGGGTNVLCFTNGILRAIQ